MEIVVDKYWKKINKSMKYIGKDFNDIYPDMKDIPKKDKVAYLQSKVNKATETEKRKLVISRYKAENKPEIKNYKLAKQIIFGIICAILGIVAIFGWVSGFVLLADFNNITVESENIVGEIIAVPIVTILEASGIIASFIVASVLSLIVTIIALSVWLPIKKQKERKILSEMEDNLTLVL